MDRTALLFVVLLSCALALDSAPRSLSEKDIRLPRNVSPKHYFLKLLPRILDEQPNPPIHGYMQVLVVCLNETREIVFHASNLVAVDLNTVRIWDAGSKERYVVTNITRDHQREWLTFHLRRKAITKGAFYVIEMDFNSVVHEQSTLPAGLFRIKYDDAGKSK